MAENRESKNIVNYVGFWCEWIVGKNTLFCLFVTSLKFNRGRLRDGTLSLSGRTTGACTQHQES